VIGDALLRLGQRAPDDGDHSFRSTVLADIHTPPRSEAGIAVMKVFCAAQ